MEWPTRCRYWKFLEVQAFLTKPRATPFKRFRTIGCAFELKILKGKYEGHYLAKDWAIHSTLPELDQALERRCPGGHLHREITGHATNVSGHYPQPMANAFHDHYRRLAGGTSAPAFSPHLPTVSPATCCVLSGGSRSSLGLVEERESRACCPSIDCSTYLVRSLVVDSSSSRRAAYLPRLEPDPAKRLPARPWNLPESSGGGRSAGTKIPSAHRSAS